MGEMRDYQARAARRCGRRPALVVEPFCARAPLTPRPPPAPQLKGVRWMISLYQNGLNGILADQMVRVRPTARRHALRPRPSL